MSVKDFITLHLTKKAEESKTIDAIQYTIDLKKLWDELGVKKDELDKKSNYLHNNQKWGEYAQTVEQAGKIVQERHAIGIIMAELLLSKENEVAINSVLSTCLQSI